MDSRRWEMVDLSEATGMTLTMVALVLKGQRNPGDRFLRGVASAFNMPQETVFRLAGMLNDEELEDIREDEAGRKLKRLLSALEPDERDKAIRLLEQYVRDHQKSAPKAHTSHSEA